MCEFGLAVREAISWERLNRGTLAQPPNFYGCTDNGNFLFTYAVNSRSYIDEPLNAKAGQEKPGTAIKQTRTKGIIWTGSRV
jgi:hypothetical protein